MRLLAESRLHEQHQQSSRETSNKRAVEHSVPYPTELYGQLARQL
jgi:hypothetical protein